MIVNIYERGFLPNINDSFTNTIEQYLGSYTTFDLGEKNISV